MNTLVQTGAALERPGVALAVTGFGWRRFAAEAAFVLALFATCVSILALRLAFVPPPAMDRGFAVMAFVLATIAAIGAFTGSARLRKQD